MAHATRGGHRDVIHGGEGVIWRTPPPQAEPPTHSPKSKEIFLGGENEILDRGPILSTQILFALIAPPPPFPWAKH